MKKFVALIVLAAIMAFAGAALAAEQGTTYVAEQNVSNVTADVSWMPSSARVVVHSSHAPIAEPDEQNKRLTFTRGSGYKEGKYVYTIVDTATGAEVGTWTLWVLNVERGIAMDDKAVKSGASDVDVAIKLMNNYSFPDDPDHPAAYESPNGAAGISSIAYYSDPKFTVSHASSGQFKADVAKITVNGVLKYSGEFIEGARDSGTLGSFYFVVSDYDVDAATASWSTLGVLSPVKFVVTGDIKANIKSVKIYDGVNTHAEGAKALAAADYTATVADGKTTFTLAESFLKTLSVGDKAVEVIVNDSGDKKVYFVVKVITGADPANNVAMKIVPDPVGLGDPIEASLDVVQMHQIKTVTFQDQDVTNFASFTSRKDDGAVVGSHIHLPKMFTNNLEEGKRYDVVVKYDLGTGEKTVSADFAVTREITRDVPAEAISPDASLKNSDVDYGVSQKTATRNEIEFALYESSEKALAAKAGEYFGEDGKLTDVAARALIDSKERLTPLHAVAVQVTDGMIAPITFRAYGKDLVSGDHKINWADANVYKVIPDGKGGMKSEKLLPARRMADIKDGTFQIFKADGATLADQVDGKVEGGLSAGYRLVVYVKDNGNYDLDARSGDVLDPVVLGRRMPVSGGGSSSSCDAGMGLAGLAALAALALRKRSK